MKKITNLQKIVATSSGVAVLAVSRVQYAFAAPDCDPTSGSGGALEGANCVKATNAPSKLFGDGSLFQSIANTLIFLVGAISVIMIIVGGLRMVLSSGNPANVKSARETIVYAIVGVIIAIMAYAIVNFVLKQLA